MFEKICLPISLISFSFSSFSHLSSLCQRPLQASYVLVEQTDFVKPFERSVDWYCKRFRMPVGHHYIVETFHPDFDAESPNLPIERIHTEVL